MNEVRRPALLVCGLLLPAVAWAQSSSSSLKGTTERIQDYYQQRQQVEPAPAAPDPVQEARPQPGPAVASGQQVRLLLRKLSFGPSELLDPRELSAITARYEGREVGMDDLQALVDEVNKAYADKGITTARARLGSQSIRDGEVHVDLVEGRLGELSIAGERPVPEEFVRRRIHQQPGDVVRVDRLRDDLVYLNQTTNLDVRALLRAGQASGLTDIVLNAQAPSKRSWGMFADNAGTETSGRERIGVQGQFWGLAGMDDLLAGSMAYSEGGLEGRVSYSGLINRRNGRLEASVARNRIDIIDGAYRELDITAESTNYALAYIQPWIATQAWALTTSAGLSRLDSTTDISDERVSDTESQVGSLGVSIAYRNDRLQWTFSQNVSRVKTEVSTVKQPGFTIASGATGLTSRLGASGLVVRGQLGWQWSNTDDIGASQLFQVGGIGSVRGYVRGVLSAPKGYFANLELHRPYRERHDVYLFVDHGEVKGGQPETKTISSLGLGFSGRFGKRLSYSLDVGHALDEVIADQDDYRADFRIGMAWQ